METSDSNKPHQPDTSRSVSPDLVSLSSSSSIESDTPFNETSNLFTETINSIESDLGPGAAISVSTPSGPNTDAKSYYERIAEKSIEVMDRESGDLQNASSVHTPGSSTLSHHQSTASSSGSRGDEDRGNVSSFSYQLLDKDKLTIPDYESAGLLYARSSKDKYNKDLLSPADEVAVEVGCEESLEEEDDEDNHLHPAQIHHVKNVVMDHPTLQTGERWIAPIDPGVLLEMETSARHMAADMAHVMDNLRNSLHAMTICTKQSMQLHRESVDNLHSAVDANIKGMYTLMSKFEELYKCLTPMKQIANQISEMDDNLRQLELAFAKS